MGSGPADGQGRPLPETGYTVKAELKSISLVPFVLLISFIGLGLLMTFALPPFQAPDEIQHWIVANARANSFLSFGAGAEPRCSLAARLPYFLKADTLPFHPERKFSWQSIDPLDRLSKGCDQMDVPYGNVATYPGVPLAKALIPGDETAGVRSLMTFYASRLLHGLLFALLLGRLIFLARASNTVPVGLSSLFAFLLSPLFVQQTFAVSADVICNALAISLASWVMFWRVTSRLDMLLLVALGALAALTKPPLVPFIPLALAMGLFMAWFKGHHQISAGPKLRVGLAAIVLSAVCALYATSYNLSTSRSSTPQLAWEISAERQIEHIKVNRMKTLAMLSGHVTGALGLENLSGPLGWLDTRLSNSTSSQWLNLLVIGFAFDLLLLIKNTTWTALSLRRAALAGFVLAVCFGSVFAISLLPGLALYLTWTPVGHEQVMGLQSRYFFPSAILVIAATGATLAPAGPAGNSKAESMAASIVAWIVPAASFGLALALYFDLARRYW